MDDLQGDPAHQKPQPVTGRQDAAGGDEKAVPVEGDLVRAHDRDEEPRGQRLPRVNPAEPRCQRLEQAVRSQQGQAEDDRVVPLPAGGLAGAASLVDKAACLRRFRRVCQLGFDQPFADACRFLFGQRVFGRRFGDCPQCLANCRLAVQQRNERVFGQADTVKFGVDRVFDNVIGLAAGPLRRENQVAADGHFLPRQLANRVVPFELHVTTPAS